MFDIITAGELLIDFTPMGVGSMDNPAYEMNPGGAPANCAAAASALGSSTAFIGKVGEDEFGSFLKDRLNKAGVDTRYVYTTDETYTSLAFVHLTPLGECSFSFLRNPGADELLSRYDLPLEAIAAAKVFHFGSLSLTREPSREAVLFAAGFAKSRGITVSYDPNYRPLLWQSEAAAVRWMREGLALADIVKMSQEEMELIVGETDMDRGVDALIEQGASVVFITMGAKGVYYARGEERGFAPGFAVNAVDTTGCGDAFCGAVLHILSRNPDASMAETARFANAAGALCATKRGGIPAMPSLKEVQDLLSKGKKRKK